MIINNRHKSGGFTRWWRPSVCLFVYRTWVNLWSHSLRGSTWRRARAYRIDSDTLVFQTSGRHTTQKQLQ